MVISWPSTSVQTLKFYEIFSVNTQVCEKSIILIFSTLKKLYKAGASIKKITKDLGWYQYIRIFYGLISEITSF